MMPNEIWEVIKKEGRQHNPSMDGFRKGGSGMRGYRNDTMYMKEDEQELQKAYACGYEEGYTEAMKKIIHIIRNSD